MIKVYNLLTLIVLNTSVLALNAEGVEPTQGTTQQAENTTTQKIFQAKIEQLKSELQKIDDEIAATIDQGFAETAALMDLVAADVSQEDERYSAQEAKVDALFALEQQLHIKRRQKVEELAKYIAALKYVSKS